MSTLAVRDAVVASAKTFQEFHARFTSAVIAEMSPRQQQYLRRQQKLETAAARLLRWHTEMAFEAISRAPEIGSHIFDRAVELGAQELRDKLA